MLHPSSTAFRYTCTAADVGSRIRVTYTPVTITGIRGTLKIAESEVVRPSTGIVVPSAGGCACSVCAGGGGGLGLQPHAHGNAARQVVDDPRAAEVRGQQKPSNDPRNNQHNPGTPTTGHR